MLYLPDHPRLRHSRADVDILGAGAAGDEVRTLDVPLASSDEVFIVQALSGG